MKRIAILTALLLSLLLTACSSPLAGNVEELLEAPKLSQDQTLVVEELNRYIGGSAKLQYPRQGEFLSPFVFKDLNGDGVQEALVFYSREAAGAKSQYVEIALLAKSDNKWAVLWNEEGLGTEVDSVRFGSMYGADASTLIVGYANANLAEKYLAVYQYERESGCLQRTDQRPYYEYALADFTGSGTDDLAVLSPAQKDEPMQVTLLTVQEQTLQRVTSVRLDSLLQSCAQLCTSLYAGEYSLVVDGLTSGGTLASEQLYFDRESGRLVSYGDRLGVDLPTLTTRVGTMLSSRDVDEDGAVEIPVVLGNVSAFSTEQRMQWVSFYDFASIEEYQNNFEKETVQPGSQIPSVLPLPTEQPDSGQPAAGESLSQPQDSEQPTFTPPADGQEEPPQEEPLPTNERAFGLADLSYGYYMQLPLSWKNRVTVERIGTRSWCLVDTASGETLLAVQILGPDERLISSGQKYGLAEDYTQVAAVGRYRIFVRVRPDTGIDEAQILDGVMVLS